MYIQDRNKLQTIYYRLSGKIEDKKDILRMFECYECLNLRCNLKNLGHSLNLPKPGLN